MPTWTPGFGISRDMPGEVDSAMDTENVEMIVTDNEMSGTGEGRQHG